MGKRSEFERNPRDLYPTPLPGAEPLIRFFKTAGAGHPAYYYEPCGGNAALVEHIMKLMPELKCIGASDIFPLSDAVEKLDVFSIHAEAFAGQAPFMFITNPPWDTDILFPLIEHLMKIAPVWLLLNADFMHNVTSAPYMVNCEFIVAVGRLKWVPESKHTGKENCCWYKFNKYHTEGPRFVNQRVRKTGRKKNDSQNV